MGQEVKDIGTQWELRRDMGVQIEEKVRQTKWGSKIRFRQVKRTKDTCGKIRFGVNKKWS